LKVAAGVRRRISAPTKVRLLTSAATGSWVNLTTATNSGRAAAIGARAVPARSMVDCAAGVALIAGPMPAQSLRARDGSRSSGCVKMRPKFVGPKIRA
jgi:hypothetical protein